ncbi:MAG: 16S rRNA (uracil(1498)-N(3))-methyltransferase [Desulfobacterales bacterium]
MRRFVVPTPISKTPTVTLEGGEAAHIATVLRMQVGEELLLLDGSGWEYRARIVKLGKNRVRVQISDRRPCIGEPRLDLTVAQALLKEKKMDRLVRRLTELGVARLIPFSSQRAVPQPNAQRWAARVRRWERIAQEAMKQCHRGRTPNLRAPITWESLLSASADYDLSILFWETADTPLSAIARMHPLQTVRRMLIILGPEGGFHPDEIAAARSQNILTATLGPRILKADTAALTATALTQFLWGDLDSNPQH